jgi:hypothetical protein
MWSRPCLPVCTPTLLLCCAAAAPSPSAAAATAAPPHTLLQDYGLWAAVLVDDKECDDGMQHTWQCHCASVSAPYLAYLWLLQHSLHTTLAAAALSAHHTGCCSTLCTPHCPTALQQVWRPPARVCAPWAVGSPLCAARPPSIALVLCGGMAGASIGTPLCRMVWFGLLAGGNGGGFILCDFVFWLLVVVVVVSYCLRSCVSLCMCVAHPCVSPAEGLYGPWPALLAVAVSCRACDPASPGVCSCSASTLLLLRDCCVVSFVASHPTPVAVLLPSKVAVCW